MKKWWLVGLIAFFVSAIVMSVGVFGIVKYRQSKCEHVFDEGTVKVEATCESDGVTTYECEKCGKTKKETIEATGHTVKQLEAIPATCESEGLTRGEICESCEKVLLEQEVTAKLNHNMVDVEGKDATCTEDGYEEGQACQDCGYSENVVIEATGHTYGEDGTCTVCGEVQESESEEVPDSETETETET